LLAAGPILHLDRVIDVLDADLVDRNLTGVRMALHVLHGLHIGILDGDGDGHIQFPTEAITPYVVPKPRIPTILDDSARLGSIPPAAASGRRSKRPGGGDYGVESSAVKSSIAGSPAFFSKISTFCSASLSAVWQARVSITARSKAASDSSSGMSPRSRRSTSSSRARIDASK